MTTPKTDTPLRHDKPIALRLTDEERLRTLNGAKSEGRSASNFSRWLFLRSLAEYEREHGIVLPSKTLDQS
jgi:hypothetical protein